jgi:hypothetical protein
MGCVVSALDTLHPGIYFAGANNFQLTRMCVLRNATITVYVSPFIEEIWRITDSEMQAFLAEIFEQAPIESLEENEVSAELARHPDSPWATLSL